MTCRLVLQTAPTPVLIHGHQRLKSTVSNRLAKSFDPIKAFSTKPLFKTSIIKPHSSPRSPLPMKLQPLQGTGSQSLGLGARRLAPDLGDLGDRGQPKGAREDLGGSGVCGLQGVLELWGQGFR